MNNVSVLLELCACRVLLTFNIVAYFLGIRLLPPSMKKRGYECLFVRRGNMGCGKLLAFSIGIIVQGLARTQTPALKNYVSELQSQASAQPKCNGKASTWGTALLITVSPEPGKYDFVDQAGYFIKLKSL